MAIAILADIVSPQERPRYLGYTMSAFASASVLGPVIGGLLSGQSSILGITGWRWIFYVNVPIGIVALVVVNRVLKLPAKPRVATRIDWPGAVVLAAGLVPLLLVAEQGRVWGWGSPGSLACYFAGVVGLIAFVWVEQRMGEAALLPIRLFHIQAFRIGSAQSVVIGIGMFGGLSAIPLYLQIVKGASPTKAGLLLLPMVAGLMITSVTVGRLSVRSGHYRKYPIFGCSLMILAMLLLSTVGADAPLWRTDIYMAMFGIGLGTNMQTIQLAMQNSVDARDIGVASSSGTFFRQVGGTLGAAVFLSILFSSAPGKIASAFTAARKTVGFQQAAAAHPDQLKAICRRQRLAERHVVPVDDQPGAWRIRSWSGFSNSMDLVFIVGAAVFVPALILAIMVKEVPLRRMSGIEAAKIAAAKAQAAKRGSERLTDRTDGRSSWCGPSGTGALCVGRFVVVGAPAMGSSRYRPR